MLKMFGYALKFLGVKDMECDVVMVLLEVLVMRW